MAAKLSSKLLRGPLWVTKSLDSAFWLSWQKWRQLRQEQVRMPGMEKRQKEGRNDWLAIINKYLQA